MRDENQALRQRVGRLVQLEAENQQVSNLVAKANATQSLSAAEVSELLRLRNEVGQLRQMRPTSETAGQHRDEDSRLRVS